MLRLAFSTRRRVVLPRLAAAALAASVTLALPAAARGPDNFSDLADKVTNAVVNISASTTVEAKDRTMQGPQTAPQGSPC